MNASTPVQTNERENRFQAIYPGVSQALAFIVTSGQSAALATKTTLVRLFATKDCFIKVGTNPTAANDGTSMFIASGIYEYIGIDQSAGAQKIAAISNGTNGTLYITEAG